MFPAKKIVVTLSRAKLGHRINELAINESHSIGQAVFPDKGRNNMEH